MLSLSEYERALMLAGALGIAAITALGSIFVFDLQGQTQSFSGLLGAGFASFAMDALCSNVMGKRLRPFFVMGIVLIGMAFLACFW